MHALRVTGLTLLALAVLGCNMQRTQVSAAPPPPPQKPGEQPIRRTSTDDKKDDVQQAGHIVRPSLGAATKAGNGLGEPTGPIKASVIARVNGQPILFQDVWFLSAAKRQEFQPKVPAAQWPTVEAEILKQQLDSLIDRELILQEARSKIPPQSLSKVREMAEREFESSMRRRKEQLRMTEEQLREFMEQQGTSWAEQLRQYERDFLAMEYMRSRIRGKLDELDRLMLLDYYRKNQKEFDRQERVVWQDIFIDVDQCEDAAGARRRVGEVQAQALAARTDAEFEAVAKKYSHRTSGVVGEGNERGSIRPVEVEEVVFGLEGGQVGPIIEMRSGLNNEIRGYHIVRVSEHTPAGRVSFEQALPDIRNRLRNKIWQTEYQKIVKELRATAHVESALGNVQ